MFIEVVPNRNSPPTVLVRESYREDGKVKKRTVANITHLPKEAIEPLRAALNGKKLCEMTSNFKVQSSLPTGHVRAIRMVMNRLGLAQLIHSRSSENRDIILALIAQRLISPESKLQTAKEIRKSTLALDFNLSENVDENAIYSALDWLEEQQPNIEKKLAKRHLDANSNIFYDLSCSSYYGTECELAKRGYNRDGLKLPSIEYGLLTDQDGRPISIQVYPGNTSDSKTVVDQITKLKIQFHLEQVVLVGDRGMLTPPQIEELKKVEGYGWISCLKSGDIKKILKTEDPSDMPVFTRSNIAEINHPDFPDERLIACFNPFLAKQRTHTRNDLLGATEKLLTSLQETAQRRTKKPYTDAQLGALAGVRVNKYKMAKHFTYVIKDGEISFSRNQESIDKEQALDGIYVIRTSEPEEKLSAEDAVRTYKSLNNVEQAFRTFKGVDLLVRPIHHHLEKRVKAHLFLCMLAYYVEWHMRRALSPLMYTEDNLSQARAQRNPVTQAQPTKEAKRKKNTGKSTEGYELQNWRGIISSLATLARVVVLVGKTSVPMEQDSMPNELQQEIFRLLEEPNPIWEGRCVQ